MKRHQLLTFVALLLLPLAALHAADTISLAGQWKFALDPESEGVAADWHKTALRDSIKLPGTTDEAEKGARNSNTNVTSHLSRLYPFEGVAWYQSDVVIPEAWRGQRVTLLLERTKFTRVWVDECAFDDQDSLATPQVRDLSAALTPGRHRLTIVVDNNPKHWPVNGGHQLSNDTQGNWNGIIGRIELRATAPVWIEEVQVYPNVAAKSARLRVTVGNTTKRSGRGTLTAEHGKSRRTTEISWDEKGAVTEIDLPLGTNANTWDEFAPNLEEIAVTLETAPAVRKTTRVRFGLCEFRTRGTQFVVNGRTTFLRGKHDACVFPLTGRPPMDVTGWERVFQIAKDYGINHYRFHSWCPPEAAFEAADRLGIYLQPELPNFGGDISKKPEAAHFTQEEGKRILRAFGNHPSFVMFALGNEMYGGRDVRAAIVKQLRAFDPRHLFAQASNYDLDKPEFAEGDDYWTTFRTAKGADGAVRGSYAHVDAPLGHIQAGPPATTNDYTRAIANVPVPVIGHEIGQFQTSPNFREMRKYTGVTRATNFEVFRQRLQAKGLLDQADDFVRASGALSVLCYREEIEAALRTPGFGGFQLLDLQDFPGQGTALVGILDAFMDSKGLIAPEQWRAFCSEIVPLALFPKYTWTTEEMFRSEIKVANYGPASLPRRAISWTMSEAGGCRLTSGTLPAADIPQGALTRIGEISVPLAKASAPRKLELVIAIEGTKFRNHYDLWVYPPKPDTAPPGNVTIARALDEETLKRLTDGGRVLLLPKLDTLTNSIAGFYAGDFWCYTMFRHGKPPGTMGILCDPKHPALAQFPTEFHANWQWFDILMNSRAIILDQTPADFRPLVQVIDNFDKDRNHKLGLVFEAQVGHGRLLVCTSDLLALQDKPEARELLASLLRHAASSQFLPKSGLTPTALQNLFSPKSP